MTETRGEYAERVDPLLEQLALRFERDPNYMASVLEAWRQQEGKSRDAQQQLLGIGRLAFTRLALCRRPDADPATFRTQVEEIAHYTGAAPAILVQLIRQVDALASMDARKLDEQNAPASAARPTPARPFAAMMAARDRVAESPDAYRTSSPSPEGNAAAADAAAVAPDTAPPASSAESARPAPGREESSNESASDPSAKPPQEPDDELA